VTIKLQEEAYLLHLKIKHRHWHQHQALFWFKTDGHSWILADVRANFHSLDVLGRADATVFPRLA